MLSATGKILTGSTERPDMVQVVTIKNGIQSIKSTNSRFNRIGYIPGVSTVTGCGRALLGIIHTIVHLACAIFDSKNREKHLEEAKLGAKNIARGCVEMLPIIGNIAMYIIDLKRMEKYEKKANDIVTANPSTYNNCETTFIYGKKIEKRSITPAETSNRQLNFLPDDYTPKVVSIGNPKELEPFCQGRITDMSSNVVCYAYASEGVDDSGWGCAWRAIQTSLSAHYNGDIDKIPTFDELYNTFGKRSFLEEQFKKLNFSYKEDYQTWRAPWQTESGWAEPFVGHMIYKHLGIPSTLLSLNGIPNYCNSPRENEDNLDNFADLRERLFAHFESNGAPVMIDDGSFAMNILGIGEGENGHTHLLIADTHLKKNRWSGDPLNGLYIVTLDNEGKQVDIDYPQYYNHLLAGSYKNMNFSGGKKWMILLPSR